MQTIQYNKGKVLDYLIFRLCHFDSYKLETFISILKDLKQSIFTIMPQNFNLITNWKKEL